MQFNQFSWMSFLQCVTRCIHHLVTTLKSGIQLIEAVQRRAARLAVNCYSRHQSVTTILQQLNRPTLHDRRDQMKLIMMYKIIHGLIYIQHNLSLTNQLPPAVRALDTAYFHQLSALKLETQHLYKSSVCVCHTQLLLIIEMLHFVLQYNF